MIPLHVVVVGQGYVGLPLAMRAVEVGHKVVGYDVDEARVKQLEAAESYVEDVSADVLAAAVASGRYVVTPCATDCGGFDVAVVAVPTPLREGAPDLSHIEAAARTLGTYLRRGATVVLESTTYPGTTEELVAPLLEEGSGLIAGVDFFLGYSPERIDPGNRRRAEGLSTLRDRQIDGLTREEDLFGGKCSLPTTDFHRARSPSVADDLPAWKPWGVRGAWLE